MVPSMTYDEFMSLWLDDSDTVLCHTSGSTGIPKPIALSKDDMRASAHVTNAFSASLPGLRYRCRCPSTT